MSRQALYVHIAFDPTKAMLETIKDGNMLRADIAWAYARALGDDRVDWPQVNRAILRRYAPSGLAWIKRCAWRFVERRRAAR